MKYGFKTIPKRVDWPTLREAWIVGDQVGAFDSGWLNDHLFGRHGGSGQHEALTLAAALASVTSNIGISHHVLANVYRHPVMLAKLGATLDHISSGRYMVGLGAGAINPTETDQYGWPSSAIQERLEQLGETVQILKRIWSSPQSGASFDGRYNTLRDARLDPPPWTAGGPPVWVGTRGRSGMEVVARWADGLAITSDGWTAESADNLTTFRRQLDALQSACAAVGRDSASLEVCVRVQTDDRDPSDVIDEARGLASNGATHLVFAVAASKGARALERLALDVVLPLRSELGDQDA